MLQHISSIFDFTNFSQILAEGSLSRGTISKNNPPYKESFISTEKREEKLLPRVIPIGLPPTCEKCRSKSIFSHLSACYFVPSSPTLSIFFMCSLFFLLLTPIAFLLDGILLHCVCMKVNTRTRVFHRI